MAAIDTNVQVTRGRTGAPIDCKDVIRRVRQRLGEDRYRVLTNNCEHFCEWCIRGELRSDQVDALPGRCRATWRGLISLCLPALAVISDSQNGVDHATIEV
jgi:hypothetical protein